MLCFSWEKNQKPEQKNLLFNILYISYTGHDYSQNVLILILHQFPTSSNKRKATWTDNEISSKSPKRTDSEKEISTTTTESEEQPVEENLEILETKSKNNQTKKNAKDESKSPAVSPDTESTANPAPSEQQVARAPQTKDQPKLATGPPGWPHPITSHPSMAWSHPLPPAQTVVVPPLSRTCRQPHTVLRLENPDRSVLTSRLDQLEREAKRLRRILGLREAVVQMSPLSDEEVSGSAGSVHDGKTDSGVETVATASVASKVRMNCAFIPVLVLLIHTSHKLALTKHTYV